VEPARATPGAHPPTQEGDPMTTFTPILRKAALTAAGLTLTAGTVAGPLATTATAAPTAPAAAAARPGDTAAKELAVTYQAQPNFYYCGPAAVRNALTAVGQNINMDQVAQQMGTTEAGTNSAHDITAALTKATGKGYTTTEIKTQPNTHQKTNLRADIRAAIDNGRPVVANIAGTATDTDGGVHSYDGGHYIAVHGYRHDGAEVKIADSANPNTAAYWITTDNLADWTATRGYSH
jgi:Peptidase_C39 like family